MQEKLMVEVIFLLGEGLFTPKMIYSWQLVAIKYSANTPRTEQQEHHSASHR